MKRWVFILMTTGLLFSAKVTTAAGDILQADPPQKKVVYVLLFKWKETASKENIAELKKLWEGLVIKVKGFDSFKMIPLLSGDYEQAVIIEFASEEAHRQYLQHEDHITLSKKGPALVDKFMEYSYWK